MAKLVTVVQMYFKNGNYRNLARLFWAIVCYLAIEARFKVKFLNQDISAMMAGFKNHAAMIQKELDIRHTYIAIEKQSY